MPTLYLVRHAQASIHLEDYDQLSPLGTRQAEQLGLWMRANPRMATIGQVWSGELKRHAQSLEAIQGVHPLSEAKLHAGLNEYDFKAVLSAFVAENPEQAADLNQKPFKVLQAGMHAWTRDLLQSPGLESWAAFQMRVSAAIKEIARRALEENRDALVMSSGGVISLFAQRALGFDDSSLFALNLALKNTSISEFRVSRSTLSLQSFNTLPHLADPDLADLHTSV